MNKEEKEAIENLKHIVEYWEPDDESDELANIEYNSIKIAVSLIDKLQKENEELKEKINKAVLMIDDNYRSEWYDDYETIAELRDDIFDLLSNKYKGVNE